MPRLNTIDRERAIVRLQAGDTQNTVANDLGAALSLAYGLDFKPPAALWIKRDAADLG